MRKLSGREKSVAVTTFLALAVTAFPPFSTAISTVIPQGIRPSVSESTSLPNKHEDYLAQVPDNCRQVSVDGGLQVRQQPSANSTVIGVVKDSERVAIKNLGASGWVPVYAPLDGYVSAAHLKYCASAPTPTPSPTPTPTPTPSSDSCRRVLASGGLQVRQQPSMNSTVVGLVADGQSVTIANRGASGWVPISAPLQGYVSAPYLRYCPKG